MPVFTQLLVAPGPKPWRGHLVVLKKTERNSWLQVDRSAFLSAIDQEMSLDTAYLEDLNNTPKPHLSPPVPPVQCSWGQGVGLPGYQNDLWEQTGYVLFLYVL